MLGSAARTALLYLAAAAVYVTIGVFVPDVLLSWPVGAGYLLLAVWIVPGLVRLLR